MHVCRCGLRGRYFSTSTSAIRGGSVRAKERDVEGRDGRARVERDNDEEAASRADSSEAATRSPDRKSTRGKVMIIQNRERKKRDIKRGEERRRFSRWSRTRATEPRDSLGGKGWNFRTTRDASRGEWRVTFGEWRYFAAARRKR